MAHEHFVKTIVNGVKKEDVYSLIDDHNKKIIESLNLGDKLRVWGVTETNSSKIKKIGRGDLVLFTANNVVEAYGEVAHNFYHPGLAKFLWGQDKYETWGNIYIVENFHNTTNISVKALNKALGYDENKIVRGFTVIDDKNKINGFFGAFDYSNGILTTKTKITLPFILNLLQEENGLTIEEIQNKTGIAKRELEPLLRGWVIGRALKVESDKYHISE